MQMMAFMNSPTSEMLDLLRQNNAPRSVIVHLFHEIREFSRLLLDLKDIDVIHEILLHGTENVDDLSFDKVSVCLMKVISERIHLNLKMTMEFMILNSAFEQFLADYGVILEDKQPISEFLDDARIMLEKNVTGKIQARDTRPMSKSIRFFMLLLDKIVPEPTGSIIENLDPRRFGFKDIALFIENAVDENKLRMLKSALEQFVFVRGCWRADGGRFHTILGLPNITIDRNRRYRVKIIHEGHEILDFKGDVVKKVQPRGALGVGGVVEEMLHVRDYEIEIYDADGPMKRIASLVAPQKKLGTPRSKVKRKNDKMIIDVLHATPEEWIPNILKHGFQHTKDFKERASSGRGSGEDDVFFFERDTSLGKRYALAWMLSLNRSGKQNGLIRATLHLSTYLDVAELTRKRSELSEKATRFLMEAHGWAESEWDWAFNHFGKRLETSKYYADPFSFLGKIASDASHIIKDESGKESVKRYGIGEIMKHLGYDAADGYTGSHLFSSDRDQPINEIIVWNPDNIKDVQRVDLKQLCAENLDDDKLQEVCKVVIERGRVASKILNFHVLNAKLPDGFLDYYAKGLTVDTLSMMLIIMLKIHDGMPLTLAEQAFLQELYNKYVDSAAF